MGLFNNLKQRLGRRRNEPQRDTEVYPRIMQLLSGQRVGKGQPVFKPTPWNLRTFSTTPYARRAINTIKNPIAQLGWEVVPKKGVEENSEIRRQCELVTTCLKSPNNEDSWRSLVEKVVTDIMLGAGAIEMRIGGDAMRPLWLYPVDALSIQIYAGWSGDRREAKYCQVPGYGTMGGGGQGIDLLADELIYIAPNPSTAHPFGCGPLEIAFTTISRLLGVGEYAGNVATNARPTTLLDLGKATPEQLSAFRSYWTNEIEGQGKMPIVSAGGETKAVKLTADGDEALYLKWQEFLKTEIVTAFDISPQNLGVERDVNRSTAEVAEDRDWDQAIKPWAGLFASHINRDAIEGRLGFSQIEFRFVGLDREDEKATSEIFATYYKSNVFTPNEIRAKLGEPPADNRWGDMTAADAEIAIAAARGAAEVDDPALTGGKKQTAKQKPSKKGK
ncbi:Phage portal protein [Aquisphaera giovannonii]|uniref:Phage portal protein n=1 Tax=Aquisphaera giovannonii TaxID=406548 RepID=A0A5B9W7G4_9BACT|nr:phage portal protein [Aquisphaera giovannonii]QEH36518.1 Phage portal protein [Aquisphaera giovannonii]